MSQDTMANEIVGQTGGAIPKPFALTLVNRAWLDVQRKYDWSFKWLDFSIPTPSPTSAGTVTLVRGINTVVGNAAAAAAWQSISLVNPITTQQFRVGQGTIYSIIAFDGNATLTLDRAYVDTPSGAGVGYQIYGVYYHAPVKNFVWFDVIRDPVTGYTIKTTKTRQEVDDTDPQRLQYNNPESVIPYKIDLTPGNFYGYPTFELWPAPLAGLTYVAQCFLGEEDFTGVTDSVTPPLGEDVVLSKAKEYAYEWCESNKSQVTSKSDWAFLIGKAQKEFNGLVNDYILKDENFSKRHTVPYEESKTFGLVLPWVSQRQNVAIF